MEKHKFALISLTMRDRVILSKFSTYRVSQETSLCNFPKIFIPLKMTAILLLISLTMRDRAISSKFLTHRVSKQYTIGNFQKKKKCLSPKMTATLKKKFASISLTM